MYYAVIDNQIVGAIDDRFFSLSEALDRFPNQIIIKSGLGYELSDAQKLLRVYNGEIVPKVTATLSTNKDQVNADGFDEVYVFIKLFDIHPQESFKKIEININGAKIPVPIDKNFGKIAFSTEAKGILNISVDDPDIISLNTAVIAT